MILTGKNGVAISSRRRYRHELKYKINYGAYEILRHRLSAVMKHDGNAVDGKYDIASVYFDDVYRTAYYDKVNGEFMRKKYRIRAYNGDDSRIAFECKYKDNEYVYKQSVLISRGDYDSVLAGNYSVLEKPEYADTSAENFLFSNALVALRPSVIVDYVREPFVCRDGNVRITFDMQLRAAVNTFDIFNKSAVYTSAFDGMVLEIKYDSYIPSYIQCLFEGFQLDNEAVSKYVICCDKYLEVNKCVY